MEHSTNSYHLVYSTPSFLIPDSNFQGDLFSFESSCLMNKVLCSGHKQFSNFYNILLWLFGQTFLVKMSLNMPSVEV